MRCHSDKQLRAARLTMAFAVVAVMLTRGQTVCAQIYAQPLWGPPPPPVVWIAPAPTVVQRPAWVQTPQQVTTFYPPAPIIQNLEEAAVVHPELDGQLRVTVTEALLSRLLTRDVTDAGPVREFILGADVQGEQFTVTRTTIDFQPCIERARFVLRLVGNVNEQTVGVTPEARVHSAGAHQFQMEKQVDFDGNTFTTRSPSAWVVPRISYRGASTFASGVPVVGDIARSIALSEAERRRPQAERIASQMLTRQAAPRFNDEVDGKLADANRQLSRFAPSLFAWIGLSPDRQSLSTSSDRMFYQLRLPQPPATLGRQLLGDVEEVSFDGEQEPLFLPADDNVSPSSAPNVLEGEAITIAVHEDLVNHILGCLPLGGREIPDTLIDHLIEILLQSIENRSFDPASLNLDDVSQAEFATVLLADEQPLSIRFDDGQAFITALAAFRPKLTQEVPTQRLEFAYSVSHAVDTLTLNPGEVTVTAAQPGDADPLTEIARPLIQQQVTQRLHAVSLPTSMDLNLPEMTPTTLRLNQVVIDDGWLTITLD
ncbi:MAG: hypothetical protein KDA93_00655 [Planctomycetaceae bacterium]|nr:hypothetical protein [Planctomycetaceae bacterium]